ncbi:MAG: cell division protein ZipA C-terminal FtsZ-binding domain-containing protein [Woeseiaceae bacterium]
MDGLRWLLLIFGALVVAGVYFYTRRERQNPPDESVESPRITPTLNDNAPEREEPSIGSPMLADTAAEDAPEKSAEPAESESVAAVPNDRAPIPQKIVTLRVVAKNKGAFPGDELILGLRGIGMRSGKFGIYHRYDGNDESRTVFSAASLVEPGSFDLKNIKEQQIPGVSFFMVVPGPLDGAEAFDLMIQAARALTQTMDAELLDESGSTLSIQRERYMREEVIQFQHSSLVS